ncbi:hypothetical protein GGF43_004671, partial [Coemansia sp. RSA 2618]
MAKKQKQKKPASTQTQSQPRPQAQAQGGKIESAASVAVQTHTQSSRLDSAEPASTANYPRPDMDGRDGSYSNSDDYEDEPDAEEEDIEDYRKGGYHPVKLGDSFKNNQYKVVRKLGWGHFSTVWLAYDHDKNIHVALKIVKSAAHYAEAALDEIELCTRTVSVKEPHAGRDFVAKMLDSFEHSGPNGRHVCMVFEVLGENLLSLLRNARRYSSLRDVVWPSAENGNGGDWNSRGSTAESQNSGAAEDKHRASEGLSLPLVKQIARQIIAGLAYLHGSCNMIHTDLKPENVLVCIDNVEEVIRNELRKDAVSSEAQDQAALVQTSRSVANSRAPSPVMDAPAE